MANYINNLGQIRLGWRSPSVEMLQSVSYLFDTTSSGSPLIAYSMRKLGSSYSGPGIRVRRTNDNTELDINFKTDGSLDTQSMLNFTNPPGPVSLILDAYTASSAAYSLRKLSGSYSGSAIRVRRTPDDAEMDIAFGADGSLDTTTLLSFVNESIPTPTGNLLDTYGTASAAFSLRKLRTGATASIRVRRTNSTNTGDNLEMDIAFDVNGNLDTTTLLSHCSGSNNYGYVSIWYDQSGSGKNVIQTTSTLQPQIVNAGVTNTQFGKPTLKFYFSSTGHYLTTTLSPNTQNVGVISVARPTTTLSPSIMQNSVVSFGPDNGWGSFFQNISYTSTSFRFGSGYSGTDTYSPTLTNYGMSSGSITSTFKSGVNEMARVNGFDVISQVAQSNTMNNTGSVLNIGAGISNTGFQGDISEVVIYVGVDRSASRHLIERHMNTYYSTFNYDVKNLYVSKWYDQSGNGKHLTNISMYHPVIVNNGTMYTSFGKPSIYFSTTKNPINFLKTSYTVNGLTTLSIISVSKVIGYGSIVSFDDLSWGGVWQKVSTSGVEYRFGIGNTTQTAGYSVSNTNGSIFSSYKNGTQEFARVNGLDRAVYTSSGTTINNTGSVMKIGGSDGYTGALSELIFYNSNRVNDRVDIETNLNIYYNIYKNSAYIKTWYDQSGSGRHAQQVTAAYQPLIVSSGTVITDGGLPSVKFSSAYYLSNSTTLPLGSTFSVFSVLRKITHVNNVGYFTFMPPSGNDYNSAGGRTFTHGPSLNSFRIEASGMDLYYTTPGNERFGFSGVFSGGTMSGRINNSGLVNTAHTTTTVNSSGVLLGARYTGGVNSFSDSAMNEFILYGSNQGTSRTIIENNINSYYTLWNNVVTSGLVLHLDAGRTASYSGTGTTWTDISGGSNNITLYNTSYSSTNSGSIYFNGTGWGYGSTSSNYNLSADFSIDFWAFFDASSGTDNYYKHIFTIGDSNNYILLQKWRSGISNGLLMEYCVNGNRYCITPSGTDPQPRAAVSTYTLYNPISVWSHITVTVISNVMYFYINGSLMTSLSLGSRWNNNMSLYIGKSPMAISTDFHKGNISNFRIYKGKGLSSTEILQNFNQTRSRFGL